MKKPYLRISESGERSIFDGDKLDNLQAAVGGYITTAPITRDGTIPVNTTAYANDVALLYGMEYNMAASAICGYPLVGPVVIRLTKKVKEILKIEEDKLPVFSK